MTRQYERYFAQAQLTSAQFSILVALSEEGPMTMLELAKVLVMDRTTLLRAMKPLQREDLLKNAASDADPRQLVFSLSPAGERKLKQAMPLWAQGTAGVRGRHGPARGSPAAQRAAGACKGRLTIFTVPYVHMHLSLIADDEET